MARVININLDKHAVVEASAGTGKTYTLEHLVRKLLVERRATLDQILVMTYTEKATGELKGRLRSNLEQALRDMPAHHEILQPALDDFDQVHVYTIHAFCQRMLQEYPFEHGQDLRPQLVDDGTLLRSCLREIQRRDWPRWYGDRLHTMLDVAYQNKNGASWEDAVIAVARSYRPAFGYRLRPEPEGDLSAELPPEELAVRLMSQTVSRLQEYVAAYKRERGLRSFDDMIIQVQRGLDPAHNPAAEALAQRLRQRFRYGIVDEFQDTDALQWQIFRRIFVEGDSSRLIVVGDPKQAIFGFRGADLPTYLNATNELKNRCAAAEHILSTNWRSAPELLHALNQLFQEGGWFTEGSVPYRPVSPPDNVEPRNKITTDKSGRPALTLIDYSNLKKLSDARNRYAQFVAGEIKRLLAPDANTPIVEMSLNGKTPRPLNAGDIAVLIFQRSELKPLVKAFRQASIPFSVYKQRGLWQTDEVDHLEYVLRALARPDDRRAFHKALLTSFFEARPEDLVRCDELPPSHRARTLFQRWNALAERRAWSPLFRSLLEDTGLLQRAALDQEEGDRRIANYRHIIGFLEQTAYAQDLDLLGVHDLLTLRRQESGEEADLQPIDTERPKVHVMTVHASKGLEFPIVFLAGGFTSKAPTDCVVYRDDAERVVLDVVKDEAARGRAKEAKDQEDRRLLYVALTRAMFKLFLPVVSGGTARGPLVNILQPALERSQVEEQGPPRAVMIAGKDASPPPAPRVGGEKRIQPAPAGELLRLAAADALPILDADLYRRRIHIDSFSSLHRRRPPAKASYVERPPRADDDTPGALDTPDPLRGPVFGDMVHNVLESVDFAAVGAAPQPADLLMNAGVARLIDQEVKRGILKLQSRIRGEALAQACRAQVADLVWRALHTPLAEAGGPLWTVPSQDRIHELEFQFPNSTGEEAPVEIHSREGFLTGFMDLVFRKEGRYFLVDWKTNWLEAYDTESLARCMAESDYIRQYRLYLQALQRWFDRVLGQDFDFGRDFGGVFYLFLRGMNGRDATGVFFHAPESEDLLLERVLVSS